MVTSREEDTEKHRRQQTSKWRIIDCLIKQYNKDECRRNVGRRDRRHEIQKAFNDLGINRTESDNHPVRYSYLRNSKVKHFISCISLITILIS